MLARDAYPNRDDVYIQNIVYHEVLTQRAITSTRIASIGLEDINLLDLSLTLDSSKYRRLLLSSVYNTVQLSYQLYSRSQQGHISSSFYHMV